MPCCMMGAIFLAQCLAVWAWFKRRLGFSDKVVQERSGIISAFRRRPKILAFIVCFELLAGGSVFAYLEMMPHEHSAHGEHSMHAEHSMQTREVVQE